MFSNWGLTVFQLGFQKLFEHFALCRCQIGGLIFVIDRKKPKWVAAFSRPLACAALESRRVQLNVVSNEISTRFRPLLSCMKHVHHFNQLCRLPVKHDVIASDNHLAHTFDAQ